MFGVHGPSLESVEGESFPQALCPVRTAARHALHTSELCATLGGSPEDFVFPKLEGDVVARHAWVETIEAGMSGLGLPLTDPYGRPRYAGHGARIGGAQALGRAGFDA